MVFQQHKGRDETTVDAIESGLSTVMWMKVAESSMKAALNFQLGAPQFLAAK